MNEPRRDLEERTRRFAKDVRSFVAKLPKTIANQEDIKQVVRSSGSIGANYIEAQEKLGKKDFALRIKISRKEAKESVYWLSLFSCVGEIEVERSRLEDEALQLQKIFGSIVMRMQL